MFSRGSSRGSTQVGSEYHHHGRGFRGGGSGGGGGGYRGSRGGGGGGDYHGKSRDFGQRGSHQAEIAPNTKYSLVTNHFPLELEQNHTIYLYNIRINP